MSNKISFFSVKLESDENGNLKVEQEARYRMQDTVNLRMQSNGSVKLDPIDPADTLVEFWEKVRQKILAQDVLDETDFREKLEG